MSVIIVRETRCEDNIWGTGVLLRKPKARNTLSDDTDYLSLDRELSSAEVNCQLYIFEN